MAKEYHCAQCGGKLKLIRKVVPQKGVILNLIEPHSCEEMKEEDKFEIEGVETGRIAILGESPGATEEKKKVKLDFDFVKKLNKAAEVEPMAGGPGDQRPKSSKREELPSSSAPLSTLNRARREAGLISPVREDIEEPEDEAG